MGHGGESRARVGSLRGQRRWSVTAERGLFLLLVGSAVLATLGARRADACVCSDPLDVPRFLPGDGELDVARDAVLLQPHYEPLGLRLGLVDVEDALVEGTWSILEADRGAGVATFRPTSDLDAGGTYRVRQYTFDVRLLPELLAEGEDLEEIHTVASWVVGTFTVGDGFGSPPAVPTVENESVVQGACGQDQGFCTVGRYEFNATVPVASGAALVVADVDGYADLDAQAPEGQVTAVWDGVDPFVLGTNICSVYWRGIELGEPAKVSFAALSGSGRLSAWSEPVHLDGAPCWQRVDADPGEGDPPEEPEPSPDAEAASARRASCGGGAGPVEGSFAVSLAAFALRRRARRAPRPRSSLR